MQNFREEYDLLLKDINDLTSQGEYTKVIDAYEEILQESIYDIITENSDLASEIYLDYSIINFNLGNYEYFLDLLLLRQKIGFNLKEVHESLLEAFYVPNKSEFEKNYIENTKQLKGCIHQSETANFEQLEYKILPVSEEKFFVYDVQNFRLMSKIDISNRTKNSQEYLNEFFDFSVFSVGDINDVLLLLSLCTENNKKGFIVIENWSLFESCLQWDLNLEINCNLKIFNNINDYQNYISNECDFLPKNILNFNSNIIYPKVYLDQIEEQRIKNNREIKPIPILSICIPSFNRGNRAYKLVREILSFNYGLEIEIVVSNNGTKNETSYYYEKIKNIIDSRLKYFSFDKNEGFAVNMCKVTELASADMVLFLSDEDSLNEIILGKILNEIYNNKEISYLKTSIQDNFAHEDLYFENPEEALIGNMLRSNYISGLIMRKSILEQYSAFQQVLDEQTNSVFYSYPHMYWELLLCTNGNVCTTSLPLVIKGKEEKMEGNGSHDFTSYGEFNIPNYAKIENRLKQHREFYEIIESLENVKGNYTLLSKMYLQLVFKTLYLCDFDLNFIYKEYFSKEFCNRKFEEAFKYCIESNFILKDFSSRSEVLEMIRTYTVANFEERFNSINN